MKHFIRLLPNVDEVHRIYSSNGVQMFFIQRVPADSFPIGRLTMDMMFDCADSCPLQTDVSILVGTDANPVDLLLQILDVVQPPFHLFRILVVMDLSKLGAELLIDIWGFALDRDWNDGLVVPHGYIQLVHAPRAEPEGVRNQADEHLRRSHFFLNQFHPKIASLNATNIIEDSILHSRQCIP